jgi:hypothetical protein
LMSRASGKCKTPERPSGAGKNRWNAAVRGCSKSERAQQDRADEREHRENRQHIEPEC